MYLNETPCAANSPVQLGGGLGCGCWGMGCSCGGGLGLFDSGFDFTQWGTAEIVFAALGVYVLFSVFSTTKRGYRETRKRVRRIRRRMATTAA